MPSAIDPLIKKEVINQWLAGDSRDRIASDNNVSAGTVTNIINEWKKGVEDSDYGYLRELTLPLKKQGIGLIELAPFVRLFKYIQKLGADEGQIESFIANCMNAANSLPPEKIINLANQLFDIAKSEAIPPVEVPIYIRQKSEEKQRLEEQTQEAAAILQSKIGDIETINEFNQLKEHLSTHNLSLEDPTRLLSILQTIRQIGYDPRKIVAAFAGMKSLRQEERQLKNNCKMFERRTARYQHILPISEQFVSFGIGIDPLIAFNILVTETADTCNVPISTAAFRVIKEIEDYRKIIGLKRELARLAVQIYSMNEILGRKNKAVMALLNLQSRGVTEDQILNVYRFLEEYGCGMPSGFKQVQNAPYIFKQ
jgi:hypothetical protein